MRLPTLRILWFCASFHLWGVYLRLQRFPYPQPPPMVFDRPTTWVNYVEVNKPYITHQVVFSQCTRIHATHKEEENAFVNFKSLYFLKKKEGKYNSLLAALAEHREAIATSQANIATDHWPLNRLKTQLEEPAPSARELSDCTSEAKEEEKAGKSNKDPLRGHFPTAINFKHLSFAPRNRENSIIKITSTWKN